MELLLKHGRDGEFELDIDCYREIFHACVETAGDRYIEAMLSYATSLKDFEVGEKIYSFIEQVLAYKKDIVMTYGQKLRKEGKVEGKIEARRERNLEIVKDMRSAGYKVDEIAKLTGLLLSEINNF
jgi:predicted transposase/invertase (TIGR01784 family)